MIHFGCHVIQNPSVWRHVCDLQQHFKASKHISLTLLHSSKDDLIASESSSTEPYFEVHLTKLIEAESWRLYFL
jgi:hypothetical protein